MPTFNQLVRQGRKKPKYKTSSPALQECPQKRGVCTRVYTSTPKEAEFGPSQSCTCASDQWD